MAYNVVVSYSTKNLHVAQWIRDTLHQPGHVEVFVAEYSVQPSQPLNEEILRAIRGCDLFVLLWSSDARSSDYVPQEIGIATGCNKTILPVVMEAGVPVPGFISHLKYLPAHLNWDGSFVWLANFIRENAGNLAQAKLLGGLATAIFGGIMMFAQQEEEGEGDDEDADEDEDDDE